MIAHQLIQTPVKIISEACEIGRGGLAVVERIVDPATGRPVARKRLRTRHLGNQRHERCLFDEADLLRELDHPGIPRVLDAGRLESGHPYFSMPLIEGHDLETLLRRRGFTTDDALVVLENACGILAYAHGRDISHGDLKPGNLMLDQNGQTFVIDWGLAQRGSAQEKDDPGSVSGTANYMSPEQALGRAIDPRTDVFNIGAILCRVLTGEPPYVGSWAEVHPRAATGDLEVAYQNLRNCDADRRLRALAQHCLAVAPHERPAHAVELAETLLAIRTNREASLWKRLFLLTFGGSLAALAMSLGCT